MNSIPTFPDFYALFFVVFASVTFVLTMAAFASVTLAGPARGQKIIRDRLGKEPGTDADGP